MVPGELHAQDEDVSVGVDVEGGEEEGEGGVDDSEGEAEHSHEASADVLPLKKDQAPVEQKLSCQTEQDGRDGEVHGVQ